MARKAGETRGRKGKERISGKGYDINTVSGKQAVNHLKYSKELTDGSYEIDTDKIEQIITKYITDNEYITKTDKEGNEYKERGVLSITGLMRSLGIGVDALSRWAKGFVSSADIDDDTAIANDRLSEIVRAGTMPIYQYWEECSDKYQATKHIRLMESHGLITPAKQVQEHTGRVSLDIGKWGRYGK